MQVMHYKSQCCVVVSVILVTYTCAQIYGHRFKRANMENFNVLLELYKLNPLMKSNFYKSFSHQAMLPYKARASSVVLNIESNESTKEKQEKTNLHLKQIERKIHATNLSRKAYKQPDYDIENINVENFTVDVIVNDQNNNNEFDRNVEKNGFDDIIGHLESNETNGNLSVTKNIPAKNEQFLVENIENKIYYNNHQMKNNIVVRSHVNEQSNNTFHENNKRIPTKHLISNYGNEVVIFK